MAQPSWAEGYVVDVGYTHGYYRELSPAALRFVTLLGGLEAPDLERPFEYYELGCGNGLSSVLHAAAHPHGRFTGVDFNPTHIHNAQRLARDAGVGNVRFLEKSFAELLDAELPEAEVIALHGVWTWVGDEHRRQIVEFIRRRLKPGGIVYVSYNSLPGLSQVAPLQRLLTERTALGTGDSVERLRHALDFAARLERAGAGYFRANPLAKARLDTLARQDPRYLVHEYANANWSLFYHADVARELAGAKLAYAGSTEYLDNFNQFIFSPEMAALVADIRDRTAVETIKDYARNQVFRRDVYTRGAPRADARQLDAMLGRSRFALARPRSACQFVRATPAGEVTMQEEAYAPVLDALRRGPLTFDQLGQAPETQRFDRNRLRQAVFGMAALGNLFPALPLEGEDARRAAVAGFNQAMLRDTAPGSAITLASPVLGAGLTLSAEHRLLMQQGQPVEPAEPAEKARFFHGELLPHYRQLGVLD